MSDREGAVLITGATGALGRSTVRRFLAAGRPVAAVGRDEDGLAALAGLAADAAAPRLSTHRVDLATADAVRVLFDDVSARWGTPAAVAHLVGGFRFATLAESSDEDWRFLLTTNLVTSFHVFRECGRRLPAAGGGAVVAVAAPAGLSAAAGVGAYAATKAGVLRLVEALAREIGPAGGRANAVLPGTLDTPANHRSMPDADTTKWISTEAVADVIHFLTTPAAAAVNGAAVRVPGSSP